MPATNSIEWNCEELLMRKLARNATISAFTFKHHEAAGASAVETIIARAVKGEKSLEAVAGWQVEVFITYASALKTPAQADAIAMAISEEVYKEDAGFVPALTDLYFASIEPDSDTTRQDTRKLRKRIVKFPIIAALIA